MRIVIVIHTLPRYSLGGSETCAAALAAELASRHDVVVCAGRPPHAASPARRERGPGYGIEWLDANPSRAPTFEAAYQDPSIDAQFDDVMARVAPDVVHIHGMWGLSNNLPMIARNHSAVVVFTLHDFWLMCPRGQRLRPADLSQCHEIDEERCTECLQPWIAPSRWPAGRHIAALLDRDRPPIGTILAKACARVLRAPSGAGVGSHVERYHAKSREVLDAVDLFIAPSLFLAREFERYGLEGERILCSDNGIDTAPFADCTTKQFGTIVRFGFLGSWMPSKGLHVLIDAFRRLTENARLVVFGGPPAGDPGVYARDILAAAADRRITFPGRVEPAQVASVFRAIDALVVPSLWYENAPLTIREAFASHTPVVASRCGGMAESVRDGIDGLLFVPGNVADLTATLRRLIREPELIPTLSRQTPAIKTVAAHAVELETAFRQLMNQEQPA